MKNEQQTTISQKATSKRRKKIKLFILLMIQSYFLWFLTFFWQDF